jgi:hypothetical protein
MEYQDTIYQMKLIILAAGMAKRFGGLKPLAPIGPGGEAIIDFAAYDCIKAGFDSVIMVVRSEIEGAIRYHVEKCWPRSLPVEFIIQDQAEETAPSGSTNSQQAPKGTAHAVAVAIKAVREGSMDSFGVVNGDDMYGSQAYKLLYQHLADSSPAQRTSHAMVAFELANTVFSEKPLTRATCEVTPDGFLKHLNERKVQQDKQGNFTATLSLEDTTLQESLPPNTYVSVNMWGFRPQILEVLETAIDEFDTYLTSWSLETNQPHEAAKTFKIRLGSSGTPELLLPDIVDVMINPPVNQTVKVIPTTDKCIGITHRQDLKLASLEVDKLVGQGIYPSKLFG